MNPCEGLRRSWTSGATTGANRDGGPTRVTVDAENGNVDVGRHEARAAGRESHPAPTLSQPVDERPLDERLPLTVDVRRLHAPDRLRERGVVLDAGADELVFPAGRRGAPVEALA